MKLIELIRLIMANKELILEIIEFIRSITSGGNGAACVLGTEQFPLMNAKCTDEVCTIEDCINEVVKKGR
jgi:hypothetical protein